MKCLILYVNCFLLFLCIGCTQKKDITKKSILVYCQMDGKELQKEDTLEIKKIEKGICYFRLFSNNQTFEFNAEFKPDYVKLFYGDSSGIIYKMDSIKLIQGIVSFELAHVVKSPFFVRHTKYFMSKKYNIDNIDYDVLMFKTNFMEIHDDDYYFAYYNSEYGFILYVIDRNKYIKVKKMINYAKDDDEICQKLIHLVLQDSSFFAYYRNPPPFL